MQQVKKKSINFILTNNDNNCSYTHLKSYLAKETKI